MKSEYIYEMEISLLWIIKRAFMHGTSTLKEPRSTKSPLNKYGLLELGGPLSSKMLSKS